MSRLSWLYSRFEANHDQNFIIWRDQSYSYGWLCSQVVLWSQWLDDEGIENGTVVAVEGDYAPEVVALLLALIDRQSILVPLTSSVEVQKSEFKHIAEVEATVKFECQKANLIVSYPEVKVTNPLTNGLKAAGDPGLVLFTSGSTGNNKGVLHNLSKLLDKFKTPRPSQVTISFLLLDHIGGINTLLHTLSTGGTIISLEGRDPDTVCRAIEAHHAELLPTSPTFLNLLLISEAHKRYDLSSLKKITYGTEVMPDRTLATIHALFPSVTLQQTYGLSELGIMRSKSRGSDSLWLKIGGEGFETKIPDGTLWIRAHSAMLGYLNAPSPFDDEGWFNTGDAVEIDGEYVRILGRKSEIINVGGLKVFPIEVENVLLQLSNVCDATVVGEVNPITGHIVVARLNLIEPENPVQLRKRVREFCRQHLEAHKIPAKIDVVNVQQHSDRFKKIRRSA